jgi:tetratricopeptide (TPR) repeat protein
MEQFRLLAASAALLVLVPVPAYPQLVGGVGANVGQSPSEARETDQKFDELRAEQEKQNDVGTDELTVGAGLVKQAKFADAVPHLERALAKHPRDVTTLIYLGFSHRMIGVSLSGDARAAEFAKALEYYRQGLEIDGRNRLLHEYTGKLYILMHDQASAEKEMDALKDVCPSGCDERDHLWSALSNYEMALKVGGAPQPAQPTK